MKTVKTIQGAERLLRKLCGDPCNFVIRTSHENIVLETGRCECARTFHIAGETQESLKFDSLPQKSLQAAFNAVCKSITRERVQLTMNRNSNSIKQLAQLWREVH